MAYTSCFVWLLRRKWHCNAKEKMKNDLKHAKFKTKQLFLPINARWQETAICFFFNAFVFIMHISLSNFFWYATISSWCQTQAFCVLG